VADHDSVPPPPPGFIASRTRGPFTTHNGPYFQKVDEAGFEHAFFALQRHCNSMGIVHGGMLTAFLDGLLATAVHRATGTASVTIHLSVDFLSMARAGEWVTGTGILTRKTKELAFCEANVRVGSREVVRGSGVFKLMRKPIEI
jgi:uncharacterized protein (TIGR00369 family)